MNVCNDPVQDVLNLTGATGAEVVFETVGGESQIISQCMQMAGRGGTVSVVGLFTKPQIIDSQEYGMAKELRLTWSNSYSSWKGVSEYKSAIDMLGDGLLDANPIITHRFPQRNISEAFAAASDKKSSGAIRVIIDHCLP